jgi:hypothetical protein
MHDSLPLDLFSVKTSAFVLATDLPGDVTVVPWCLLVATLTLPNVSTRIRLDCLEVGFWFFYLYQDARCSPTRPSSHLIAPVAVRPAKPKQNRLYTRAQIRDANNMFVALIIFISCLTQSFSLNRLATDRLEHAFGHARIRSRHVNTMKAMIHAFVGGILSFPRDRFFGFASFPHRRISVGVDCLPLARAEASIFSSTPKEIPISLLIRSKFLPNSVPPVAPAWKELRLIHGLPTWVVDDSSAGPFLAAAMTRPNNLSLFDHI